MKFGQVLIIIMTIGLMIACRGQEDSPMMHEDERQELNRIAEKKAADDLKRREEIMREDFRMREAYQSARIQAERKRMEIDNQIKAERRGAEAMRIKHRNMWLNEERIRVENEHRELLNKGPPKVDPVRGETDEYLRLSERYMRQDEALREQLKSLYAREEAYRLAEMSAGRDAANGHSAEL